MSIAVARMLIYNYERHFIDKIFWDKLGEKYLGGSVCRSVQSHMPKTTWPVSYKPSKKSLLSIQLLAVEFQEF